MKISIMEQEALSAPTIVARQLSENIPVIAELTRYLIQNPPPFVFTIARGSSDHAAYFAQYLAATQAGLLVASMPPSLTSMYQSELNVKNALAIAISQSGASPDICASLEAAKKAGATTVAIVNQTDSRLAGIADFVIPLLAGKENAVAATKSYIASLTALIQLFAHYRKNTSLLQALPLLPERMQEACEQNWSLACDELQSSVNLIVLGRGLNYPIAEEAALKFKETCNIHAESFSSAEFQHGPMALAKEHFPLFIFAQQDATYEGVIALSERMTKLGLNTLLATPTHSISSETARHHLTLPASLHPACDPVVSIQAFYPMVARLACLRGYNPDQPQLLKKITETH